MILLEKTKKVYNTNSLTLIEFYNKEAREEENSFWKTLSGLKLSKIPPPTHQRTKLTSKLTLNIIKTIHNFTHI